jgi:hypothetical protein
MLMQLTDAQKMAAAQIAVAMQAHPNWSKPGYTVTHEELEADRHAHALQDAIDYFKATDPDRLAALLKD